MSSDRELINEYGREITIQSKLLVSNEKSDVCRSNSHLNTSKLQSCARGKCIKMHFAHIGSPTNSSSMTYENIYNTNTPDECISYSTTISPKQGSSGEIEIKSTSILNNERLSIVIEMNQPQLNNEELSTDIEMNQLQLNNEESSADIEMNQPQLNNEESINYNHKENVLLPSSSKYSINNLNNDRRITCRLDIENEIGKMIHGILALKDEDDKESLDIVDCYCHFDVLFEKLKNSKQTIYEYLQHNSSIYNKGIDMIIIIQSFFAPHHIRHENWNNQYKHYLDHPCVYATCGISPLFAHHFDMNMELDLRRALNHRKVVGVGEIGLDFETLSRPDDYVQINTFIKQLRIAKEKKLPIVLISRNSFIETLRCLSDELNTEHPIHWRNFAYNTEELEMLHSQMKNIFFGCSPQVLHNKKLQMNIEKVSIDNLLPESAAPHMMIEECPHVWNTHPLFAIQVYRIVSQVFKVPVRNTVEKLVNNAKNFYQLK